MKAELCRGAYCVHTSMKDLDTTSSRGSHLGAIPELYPSLGLLHNLGDGCRGQNRGRDGRGTATGGPR